MQLKRQVYRAKRPGRIWKILGVKYNAIFVRPPALLLVAFWDVLRVCVRSCTNLRDKGVLTASKFSAGYADRERSGKSSKFCALREGTPTPPRLVTPYRGATWLVFNFQIYFMPFASQYSRVFSANPSTHPFSPLRHPFRLDSVARVILRTYYSVRISYHRNTRTTKHY